MILSMRDLPNPKVVRSLSFPLTCTSNRFHSKMKAAAHCPCQTASNFTCHIAPSPSECRWVLGLLEVKRETRNVLSVKVQATHHCKASKKICLQLKNMLYGIIRKWVIYIYIYIYTKDQIVFCEYSFLNYKLVGVVGKWLNFIHFVKIFLMAVKYLQVK